MNNGCAGERYTKQVLFGFFGAFLDGKRNFFSFSIAQAYLTGAVANNDECCEREAPPAFNHFGDSIYVNHS
jgi:hypothetical protein